MTEPASSAQAQDSSTPAVGTALLSASNLCKSFGSLVAIDNLSFAVGEGEVLGIAGPNGAGKSTLLNLCTGIIAPDSGELVFQGRRIDGMRPHQLCHAGIARTFQIPTLFETLTVRQNIEIGAMFGGAEGEQGRRRGELVEFALEAAGLSGRAGQRAGTLALLSRKMTMLAAAIATRPRLVFMDEPMGGLTADEVDAFSKVIRELHARMELALVLVEHKVRALAALSDRMMILHYGNKIALDRPDVVIRDPHVIDVYLGDAESD